MLNHVAIQGRLVRDPDFKKLSESTSVCEFSIANNRYIGKNEDGSKRELTHFIDVKVWGKLAEACAKNLERGRSVIIQGELQQQSWVQDDKKRSKLYVNASQVHFLGGRGGGKSEEEQKQDEPQKEPEV